MGGGKEARAPDEPHLLYTPLPVPPSIRPSSERQADDRRERERMDWRPIGDRFRSLAKVEWTRRRGAAGGKDGMMPIWTETATERTVVLLQGKYATLSP